MEYSVDIEATIDSLAYCLNKVNNEIEDMDWEISINAGGVNCGVYFNFDTRRKMLEISNEPSCDDCTPLDDIIKAINNIE